SSSTRRAPAEESPGSTSWAPPPPCTRRVGGGYRVAKITKGPGRVVHRGVADPPHFARPRCGRGIGPFQFAEFKGVRNEEVGSFWHWDCLSCGHERAAGTTLVRRRDGDR